MITLHLHGSLAKLFGDTVPLAANSPREAVTALSYQSGEYKEILRSNDWHIFVGDGNDISESELDMNLGRVTEVYLVPKIEGAGGTFNFIAGAVLIGAAIFMTGGIAALGFAGASGLSIGMFAGGVGMVLGGIVQMMTKVPGTPQGISRDSADDKASFLFNGPSNTATQGVAIPRGYGRMLVGSIVVSAALYAENTQGYTVAPVDLKAKVDGWVKK